MRKLCPRCCDQAEVGFIREGICNRCGANVEPDDALDSEDLILASWLTLARVFRDEMFYALTFIRARGKIASVLKE